VALLSLILRRWEARRGTQLLLVLVSTMLQESQQHNRNTQTLLDKAHLLPPLPLLLLLGPPAPTAVVLMCSVRRR
jgi:hypothetical protein